MQGFTFLSRCDGWKISHAYGYATTRSEAALQSRLFPASVSMSNMRAQSSVQLDVRRVCRKWFVLHLASRGCLSRVESYESDAQSATANARWE